MRKYNVFVHVVCNLIIISVLFGLYVACVPVARTTTAVSPYYKGDTKSGGVALMINVYWGDEYLPDMLKVIREFDAVCTFFVGGSWAEKNMELLNELAETGEIGNHGYLHKDHAKISEQANREEIKLCDTLVEKVTGIKMNLFAPPSGSYNNTTLKICEELGYEVIMWSKDTVDWRDKDYELVYKRATSGVQSGDMILMHPTAHTLKALPMILKYYAENNLKTVTVSEIIAGVSSNTF